MRALLNDRANLKQNAQQLISALLTAYNELLMNGVASRSIQPSTVAFREDLKQAMFTDIRRASMYGEEPDRMTPVSLPYSILGDHDFDYIKSSCNEWDKWAVGVMILEILVGSNLCTWCSRWVMFKQLFDEIAMWLDEETAKLLNYLCWSNPEYSC